MSDINIFEQAARLKLRFDGANKSGLSVEQLFDLPLKASVDTRDDLDGVSRILLAEINAQQNQSMVATASTVSGLLDLKRQVLQSIIDSRKAENAARVAEVARLQEIAKLKEILGTKRAAALENLSEAEINERLAKLGA